MPAFATATGDVIGVPPVAAYETFHEVAVVFAAVGLSTIDPPGPETEKVEPKLDAVSASAAKQVRSFWLMM